MNDEEPEHSVAECEEPDCPLCEQWLLEKAIEDAEYEEWRDD